MFELEAKEAVLITFRPVETFEVNGHCGVTDADKSIVGSIACRL